MAVLSAALWVVGRDVLKAENWVETMDAMMAVAKAENLAGSKVGERE